MLAEYARFVEAIFPSLTPDTTKQLLDSAGFKGFTEQQYYATELGDQLCQGDIVEGLQWVLEQDDGSFRRPTMPGMLISQSCDIDNADEWLAFAPCFDFDKKLRNAGDLKKNEVYDSYYMVPHQGKPARVVYFANIQAMRSGRLLRGLQDGSLRRVEHLTQVGFYHFVSKLTIHFLRPQSADEVRYSCTPPFSERLEYAAKASVGLARYAVRGNSG